jgi:hypothetical protein
MHWRWMPAAVSGSRGRAVRAGTGAPRGRHGPPGGPRPSANFHPTSSDPRRSPLSSFCSRLRQPTPPLRRGQPVMAPDNLARSASVNGTGLRFSVSQLTVTTSASAAASPPGVTTVSRVVRLVVPRRSTAIRTVTR